MKQFVWRVSLIDGLPEITVLQRLPKGVKRVIHATEKMSPQALARAGVKYDAAVRGQFTRRPTDVAEGGGKVS